MLLVRQPISRVWRIMLGIVSVAILIGLYTYLADARQQRKRAEVADKVPPMQAALHEVEQKIEAKRQSSPGAEITASDSSETLEALEAERTRLQQQIKVVQLDAATATDRTVPTWKTLWNEGLRRAWRQERDLRPGEYEYWLWEDTAATVSRLVAGLAFGVLLSVALGLLMGAYSPIEAFFVPPLAFLAKIPPTAMLAVFFVLVGTNFRMYVTMIAFGTLPTLAQTIYQSAKKDVPEALVFKAYTLGASHAELIWNVIYKQILPRMIDAIRLQIGPAMVLLVAAEWMVAGEGFGYRLRIFYQRTDMSVVYVYLIILGAAGLLTDYGLIWLRRWICPWFGE